MRKLLGIALSLLMIWSTFSVSVLAAETPGAQLFSVHCAGCHANGGNIIRRNKTLKLQALQRNGVNSLAAIAALVTNGKNNMPAYKDRLSAQQIQTVSTYVLEQAAKGWK